MCILREIGPSFGLCGALVPSNQLAVQRTEEHSSVRLTNDLKTEVMHTAMIILRKQLKKTNPSEGIQSLRRVINLNEGLLTKLLDCNTTDRKNLASATPSNMTEE